MQSIPQPTKADPMGLMVLLALQAITCPIYKGYPSEYKPLQLHKYSKCIQGFLALIPDKKGKTRAKINKSLYDKVMRI